MGSPTCPTCGLTMERFSLGYNIEAWRCLAKDKTFHAYDATPTPPAPADDAKRCCESRLLVCATCGTAQGYGGPADDASGAEAMRERYAKPCRKCGLIDPRYICKHTLRATPATRATAASAPEPWVYMIVSADDQRGSVLTELAQAERDLADLNDPRWECREGARPFRIVPLAPLPASDDAVEEAARLRKAVEGFAWDVGVEVLRERRLYIADAAAGLTLPSDRYILEAAIARVMARDKHAALRREKGGA